MSLACGGYLRLLRAGIGADSAGECCGGHILGVVWAHPSKADDGYRSVKDTASALFQVPQMKKHEAKLRGLI